MIEVPGMRGVTRSERSVSKFVVENPSLDFRLTNHVFDRLRHRMGWTRSQARARFPGRRIRISLSEGIVEPAKGGAWKILLFGWGKFVVLFDVDTEIWVAVTFYPEKW